jgi:hypothetical protein
VNKTPTGIEISQNGNMVVKLFPNPVSNEPLSVSYTLQKEGQVVINILTVEGKLVHTSRQKASIGEHIQKVDISDLAPGNYLVQLRSDDFVVAQEIIKR